MPKKTEAKSKSSSKDSIDEKENNSKKLNKDEMEEESSKEESESEEKKSTKKSKQNGKAGESETKESVAKTKKSSKEDKSDSEEEEKEEDDDVEEKQLAKKRKTNNGKEQPAKVVVEEKKIESKKNEAKKSEVSDAKAGPGEKILARDFYTRDVITLSKDLLGKIIVRKIDNQIIKCKIVETEAYAGAIDKACHAYNNKKTARTKPMFMEGGHVYIFSVLGNNFCLNITASKEGDPSATLIRAVEITEGMDYVRESRKIKHVTKSGKELSNGPGKVGAALRLDKSFNEHDLTKPGELYLIDGDSSTFDVVTTKRIQIDYAEEFKDKPWRFCIKDNICVSVKADPVDPEPLDASSI